jgi:hypothetical protein
VNDLVAIGMRHAGGESLYVVMPANHLPELLSCRLVILFRERNFRFQCVENPFIDHGPLLSNKGSLSGYVRFRAFSKSFLWGLARGEVLMRLRMRMVDSLRRTFNWSASRLHPRPVHEVRPSAPLTTRSLIDVKCVAVEFPEAKG